MSNTEKKLEQFIEKWIPINVRDAQYVREAKVAARKEFIVEVKSRESALLSRVVEIIGEDEPLLMLGGTKQQDKANMGLNNLISQRNNLRATQRTKLDQLSKEK